MSKILCIDFGTKRIGLSIPIRSIAFGLETVDYNHLIATIDKYIKNKYIDTLVIGHPIKSDNLKSEKSLFPIEKDIRKFINFLKTKYPKLIIKRIDERFSSKIANYFLINSFFNKKKRKQKKILDQISAILLLQDFLSNSSFTI
ncbi:MAG: Holliday junction resolvase RuvX [Candidatus Karelsulcia muelleri]